MFVKRSVTFFSYFFEGYFFVYCPVVFEYEKFDYDAYFKQKS